MSSDGEANKTDAATVREALRSTGLADDAGSKAHAAMGAIGRLAVALEAAEKERDLAIDSAHSASRTVTSWKRLCEQHEARVAALEAENAELKAGQTMLRDAWNAHMATCPLSETDKAVAFLLPTREDIAAWMNAPSDTASAELKGPEAGGDRVARAQADLLEAEIRAFLLDVRALVADHWSGCLPEREAAIAAAPYVDAQVFTEDVDPSYGPPLGPRDPDWLAPLLSLTAAVRPQTDTPEETLAEVGSSAADMDGSGETPGDHESVGERQGRQPASASAEAGSYAKALPAADPVAWMLTTLVSELSASAARCQTYEDALWQTDRLFGAASWLVSECREFGANSNAVTRRWVTAQAWAASARPLLAAPKNTAEGSHTCHPSATGRCVICGSAGVTE